MLRVFLALNILLLNLYACKGGYDSCIKKIIDSNTIKNKTLTIPVAHNQILCFSDISTNKPQNVKILKHNPFLNLYLIEDKNSFKHPFRINKHLSLGTAIVTELTSQEGMIIENQLGLNSFAKYNTSLIIPTILTNSCCALEGIVTSKGIIQKEYIDRFLSSKENQYSDIGIRVKDEKSMVLVYATDPFIKNNPFMKDDCIIKLNGKKVKNSAEFMRTLLFSKVGTKQKVKIIRDKKRVDLVVVSHKRFGGGYISDTFLEQYGIYFDDNLLIAKIIKNSKNSGLKVGDKLLQVNGDKVENQQEVMKKISNFKDFASILFEREHFQFFVNIK